MDKESVLKELNISSKLKNEFNKLPKYAQKHSLRVALLTEKVAKKLNIKEEKAETIKTAALFHDIGKINFPEWIHKKRERLTKKEREEYILEHPRYTETILKRLKGIEVNGIKMAGQHHEKLNGSGYHRGINKEEIMYEAKIITCCDIFEAITAERSYSEAKKYSETKEIMIKEVKNNKIDKEITMVTLEAGKELLIEDLKKELKNKGIIIKGNDKEKLIETYDKYIDYKFNKKMLNNFTKQKDDIKNILEIMDKEIEILKDKCTEKEFIKNNDKKKER